MYCSDTLRAYQPCSTRTSCRPSQACTTTTTITPKVTRFTAVFSEEWNWSFSPKTHRSRRRRFANSGERTSGFTAVFSDDWKDHDEDEDEVHLQVQHNSCPDGDHSLQWDKGLKRKRDADYFSELLNPRNLSCSNRKCEEQECTSQRATSISPTTSPEPREDQFKGSDSESWPSTPEALKSLNPSFMASINDDDMPALSPEGLQHSMASLSGPVHPIDIEMTMWSETERNLYLSLADEESRELSFALQDLTRKRHQEGTSPLTGPATPEHTSSCKDECEIGDQGFDFWDHFIECHIAGEG
ncbi:hypothetical protein IFR04_013478 [Cadophora malorum]|uniref:Uncharacterized protein n=1 Tax=Cadophora malorum TaxID=108018 RepID=A0A8H7T4R3_9HELO|nr:hypothetical protein IFR04_013478 [Cadophora malorum]